jgi:hypothetical protein
MNFFLYNIESILIIIIVFVFGIQLIIRSKLFFYFFTQTPKCFTDACHLCLVPGLQRHIWLSMSWNNVLHLQFEHYHYFPLHSTKDGFAEIKRSWAMNTTRSNGSYIIMKITILRNFICRILYLQKNNYSLFVFRTKYY